MKLRLVLNKPGCVPETLEFTEGPVTLGRSAHSTIVIEGNKVSRTHISLDLVHGEWVATHQGSLTPTLMNDTELPHGQPRRLHEGDVLTVHRNTIHVAFDRDSLLPELEPMSESFVGFLPDPEAAPTVAPTLPPLPPAVGARPGPAGNVVPTLVAMGDESGQLELREVERAYEIGRSPTCDFVLSNSAVSRRNAIVRYDGARMYVRDAGARSPLRVNGRPVFGESPLTHGDVLSVGPVDLRVVTEAEAHHPPAPTSAPGPPPPAAPEPAPGASWDQVAKSGSGPAPDWSASSPATPESPPRGPSRSAPPPRPPDPPTAPPADWAALASPSGGAPPPAWKPPPEPAAPGGPPEPVWNPGATPTGKSTESWSGPPPVGGAPPPPDFSAPTPPPVAPAPKPPPPTPPPAPEAESTVAPAPGPKGAPAATGGAVKVVARRASSHRGWLIAGVISMFLAVSGGIALLVLAFARGAP